MDLAATVKFLSSKLKPGEEVGPTRLRLLLHELADLCDEAYEGSEVFWLEYWGYITPFPHKWVGK
jgi:hypothetical protein